MASFVFKSLQILSNFLKFSPLEWDYFTSFYFFFISLTTVGLGDVMPQHPRFASGIFNLHWKFLANLSSNLLHSFKDSYLKGLNA